MILKKKSLGQHFLHSPHYLSAIVDAAHVKSSEQVIEIGPGDGSLTATLLGRGAHVIAIEKDSRLISILTEKFSKEIASKQLTVTEEDALTSDFSKLLSGAEYKIVANIPYYITGALLKKIFSTNPTPNTVALLVQKEVATRIARSKKESILSLSVKAYGTPRYIKTVPRGAFVPPPSVDSALLLIEHISRKNFKTAKIEKNFFALVKTGFSQKRKLLKRNLEPLLGKNSSQVLTNAGLAENIRAEDVPLEAWLKLSSL